MVERESLLPTVPLSERGRTVEQWCGLYPLVPEDVVQAIVGSFTDVPVKKFVDVFIERILSQWQPQEL